MSPDDEEEPSAGPDETEPAGSAERREPEDRVDRDPAGPTERPDLAEVQRYLDLVEAFVELVNMVSGSTDSLSVGQMLLLVVLLVRCMIKFGR